MRSFDQKVFEATVRCHQPVEDVASFCKRIEDHICQTHDWALTTLDYYIGGHHLAGNGWNVWEKIHAKRLKARSADSWEEMTTRVKTKAKPKTETSPAPVLPSTLEGTQSC